MADVSNTVRDIPRTGPHNLISGLIERFAESRRRLEEAASRGESVPLSPVKIRPPLPRPTYIECIAVNYMEDGTRSESALINAFHKSPSAIIGPDNTMVLPDVPATIFEGEAEVAVVIGKRASNVRASRIVVVRPFVSVRTLPANACFALPPKHVPVLAHESGALFFGGAHQMLLGPFGVLDELTTALRKGGGGAQPAYFESKLKKVANEAGSKSAQQIAERDGQKRKREGREGLVGADDLDVTITAAPRAAVNFEPARVEIDQPALRHA